MMAAASTPTRREIVILTSLLIFLLFFTRVPTKAVQQSEYTETREPNVPPPSNQSHPPNFHISWTTHVPQTSILAHVPGWTIFERLYIFNGTVFIVTDEPTHVPKVVTMYSKGLPIENGKKAEDARLPTDKDIRVINTQEAQLQFGTGAHVLDGVTYFVNDPSQLLSRFMILISYISLHINRYSSITHYYHWSAELWFGFWRTYTSLDPTITQDGNTTLPPVRRLVFNHLDGRHWRDYANMNQWVVRSNFPSAVMEFMEDWKDRAEMRRPFVFERVILEDRSSAWFSLNYARSRRTASPPSVLPGSVHWWNTMRNLAVQFTGIPLSTGGGTRGTPVITYISRQKWGRRMLIPEDHDRLVKELYKLRDEHGFEVNVVNPEKMSRLEQLQLAARTTIMMGVHGNGLTSLVWMNPTPRSTVMEFFYPGGFTHDYEYTTRALGMTHYGFWGSKYFTSPDLPKINFPEGFQGNSIPIDGALVARLCLERLTLRGEVDD